MKKVFLIKSRELKTFQGEVDFNKVLHERTISAFISCACGDINSNNELQSLISDPVKMVRTRLAQQNKALEQLGISLEKAAELVELPAATNILISAVDLYKKAKKATFGLEYFTVSNSKVELSEFYLKQESTFSYSAETPEEEERLKTAYDLIKIMENIGEGRNTYEKSRLLVPSVMMVYIDKIYPSIGYIKNNYI